jgi:hypothetical protein
MAHIRNYFIIVTTLAVAGASGVIAGLTASLPPAAPTTATTTGIATGPGTGTGTGTGGGPTSPGSGVAETNPADGCSFDNNQAVLPPGVVGAGADSGNKFFLNDFNAYRTANGLPTLTQPTVDQTGSVGYFTTTGATVFNVAQGRLDDMNSNHYIGVVNSRGLDISQELTADHIPFTSAAMIVFKGCLSGNPLTYNDALQAWAANPTTAAALNNPNWTDVSYQLDFVGTKQVPGQTIGNTSTTGYYLIAVVFRQGPPNVKP